MSSRIQAAVAAAALFLVACQSGEKGDPGATGPSGPAGIAGPSGPSGPSGPAAVSGGRLRAYQNDGTDLGFVYAVFPMSVTFGPTPNAGTLAMLLLKQQAPGAASPVLLYRTPLSGAATTCQLLYESADCTPTAGWPVVLAPASGGACVDPDGRAWVAAPGATPQTYTPGSRRFALWDGPTQSVSSWTCVAGGPLSNAFAGEDRGVPPTISGRIYYLPAD